jgi:hypothetical protein
MQHLVAFGCSSMAVPPPQNLEPNDRRMLKLAHTGGLSLLSLHRYARFIDLHFPKESKLPGSQMRAPRGRLEDAMA